MAPPKPYTAPFLESDEELTDGVMHLALMQDSVKITCDDMIRIEETVLKFLQLNVGDDDTFRPACAYINENSVDEQIVRGSNGKVAMATALQVEVSYYTKKKFAAAINKQALQRRKELETKEEEKEGIKNLRALQVRPPRVTTDVCDSSNHHLCCSQESINGDLGRFCSSLGCDRSTCGGVRSGVKPGRPGRPGRPARPGRRSRQAQTDQDMLLNKGNEYTSEEEQYKDHAKFSARRMQNGKNCRLTGLENKSFNQAINQNTAFKHTELVLSLLNDTDTSLVASCSVNWYIVSNGGIPSVTCDQYDEKGCVNNQDLVYDEGDVTCLEPSSMPSTAPSMTPSKTPSLMPSTTSAPSYR